MLHKVYAEEPMRLILDALLSHGYLLLFGAVLLEQLGVPLPSVPVLLAAGALAATGKISLSAAVLVATAASLAGDLPWYWLGKRRGMSVLRLLCRISLEPDSCVRNTEDAFVRRGSNTLLFAKFLPGLSTAAPPLAGITKMHLGRFLAFDGAGSFVWAFGYLLVGWMFGDQLEKLAAIVASTGQWLAAIVLAPVLGWVGWKYAQRRRFIRKLRVARIEPETVKLMMDRGEGPTVIDLRHPSEGGETLPGAIQMSPDELDQRAFEIPLDRDIILYCS